MIKIAICVRQLKDCELETLCHDRQDNLRLEGTKTRTKRH